MMLQRSLGVAGLCLILTSMPGGLRLSTPAMAQSKQAAEATSASYTLAPTDRIRLKVYGEADISGEYEIDSSGYASIPLAGRIRAGGLTTGQLERSITAALSKGIVRDPRVNIEMALYRPYYILGEVKKAGEYPYRIGMTILDAVASAGGLSYRANENKVFLRRSGGNTEEVYPLDAPVRVFPGDNIRIPERYF
ncbi:polysaccharide biosynthesis/export family protein [Tardiphaga sp. vice304]|uniref:polysaccharide biosynthesis/export family protein n=1 Tax=Tardiphaga sp. vice304 TaxID=2592817 RepID=UPI001FF0469B|nr:polysaccharide biosynthesis/export family protein [Tardiphaga sp. vice304]